MKKKVLVFKDDKFLYICKDILHASRKTKTPYGLVELLIKNGQKTLKGYSFDEEI